MNTALILSGGTGTRLGSDIPKQYIKVDDRMIISYCLETLLKNDNIDYIQIVADEAWHKGIEAELNVLCSKAGDGEPDGKSSNALKDKFKGFSVPGANRQLSIYNGLTDISKYADDASYVLIHDAARPFLTGDLIDRCFEAVLEHDGVMPVLPMKDTVYMSHDGKTVANLIDRSKIYAGQAPELFVLGKYYEANTKLLSGKIMSINGSTEPAIMAGMDIAMIPGDENNFKITTKADLEKMIKNMQNN
ncbi:MAG: 2-C-methyl-D-erythritol 4-phosphate cytidylyltransferase [Lachnospiraceae bacterium]|nr:2-C-methyl-D-erythritol 4-phosphate cytidylyltransferase [Lachnospiraceae bacterium]